jgi:hypothetical protein
MVDDDPAQLGPTKISNQGGWPRSPTKAPQSSRGKDQGQLAVSSGQRPSVEGVEHGERAMIELGRAIDR